MNKIYGIGYCPGTCGELVQGFDEHQHPFHISFPIDLGSVTSVLFKPLTKKLEIIGDIGEKVYRAIELAAKKVNLLNGEIYCSVHSELEIGKGMASSTADITSAVKAVFDLVDQEVSADILMEIATSIESSDGVAYAGIAAVNQKNGFLHHVLTTIPDLYTLMLIPDIKIETCDIKLTAKYWEKQSKLLKEFCTLNSPTSRELARLATESSLLNQEENPNFLFKFIYSRYKELKSIGVILGHTGSLVGLLFETEKDMNYAYMKLSFSDYPDLNNVHFIKTHCQKNLNIWN